MKNKKSEEFYQALNYRMDVYFHPEDDCWFARLPELWGVMSDGKSPEEAVQKVQELKREMIHIAYEQEREIPEPRVEPEYSGRFLLRVPRSLHKRLADEAEREETSINRLAIQLLSSSLERRDSMAVLTDCIKSAVNDAVEEKLKSWLSSKPSLPTSEQRQVSTVFPSKHYVLLGTVGKSPEIEEVIEASGIGNSSRWAWGTSRFARRGQAIIDVSEKEEA